jgi:hypothetical protein
MFTVGQVYKTLGGADVTVLEERYAGSGFHVILGSDDVWRWGRKQEQGKVCGPEFDMTYPENLIPPVQEKEEPQMIRIAKLPDNT